MNKGRPNTSSSFEHIPTATKCLNFVIMNFNYLLCRHACIASCFSHNILVELCFECGVSIVVLQKPIYKSCS